MLNFSTSTVLLYHSINKGTKLKENFHSVTFNNFSKQINHIKDNYKIESIEKIYYSKYKKTAAITFDDGYRDLVHQAVPFLEELKIPYTIFWNPNCSKIGFWRDKLRFILKNNELRSVLLEKIKIELKNKSINIDNIYKKSKSYNINNKLISNICDEILDLNKYNFKSKLLNYADIVDLCKNTKYLKIGNHSLSHYNLASLDKKDLSNEIEISKKIISKLPKSKISSVFSIPFGGSYDINDHVVNKIIKSNYKGLLMSRNMINIKHNIFNYQKLQIPIIERFMPKDINLKKFKSQLLEVKTKTALKKLINIPKI